MGRDSKVSQLDAPVLVGEDIGALDVTVDDTLIVQINQALQDLRNSVSSCTPSLRRPDRSLTWEM